MNYKIQIGPSQEKSASSTHFSKKSFIADIDSSIKIPETDYRTPHVFKKKGQRRKKVSLNYWIACGFKFPGTSDEFVGKIQTLRPCDKQILSHLIHFKARGIQAFMSQEYIAHKTGYSRQYINARIQHLLSLGLLDLYRRGKASRQQSNVYQVAAQFFNKELWDKLLVIPAIRSMFLLLLLVAPLMQSMPTYLEKPRSMNKLTLLKNKDLNFINRYSTDTCNAGTKKERSMQNNSSSLEQFKNFYNTTVKKANNDYKTQHFKKSGSSKSLNGNEYYGDTQQYLPSAFECRMEEVRKRQNKESTNIHWRKSQLRSQLIDLELSDPEAQAKIEASKEKLRNLGLL